MKTKILITICLIAILIETYFIIKNYWKGDPFTVNIVLLIGFLGAIYLISSGDNTEKRETKSKKNFREKQ